MVQIVMRFCYSLVCVEEMKQGSTLCAMMRQEKHMDKRELNKLVLFYYVSSNYSVQCKFPNQVWIDNKKAEHQIDIIL